MMQSQLISFIPKNTRSCIVSPNRPFKSNKGSSNNQVATDFYVLPLPVVGSNYRNELHRNHPESDEKRYRYIGYSNQGGLAKSFNTNQTTEFNERLNKQAGLYDGWFSRNVENLDLAPSSSKT